MGFEGVGCGVFTEDVVAKGRGGADCVEHGGGGGCYCVACSYGMLVGNHSIRRKQLMTSWTEDGGIRTAEIESRAWSCPGSLLGIIDWRVGRRIAVDIVYRFAFRHLEGVKDIWFS